MFSMMVKKTKNEIRFLRVSSVFITYENTGLSGEICQIVFYLSRCIGDPAARNLLRRILNRSENKPGIIFSMLNIETKGVEQTA